MLHAGIVRRKIWSTLLHFTDQSVGGAHIRAKYGPLIVEHKKTRETPLRHGFARQAFRYDRLLTHAAMQQLQAMDAITKPSGEWETSSTTSSGAA